MLKNHWRSPMMNNNIQFKIAEVKPGYDLSYTDDNPEDLYTIWVQEYDTSNSQIIPCRPASNMIKHIPIIGEHVLIFKGIDQKSNADDKFTQWYYFNPYPIQSGINSNILPTISQPRTGDVSQPQPGPVPEDTPGFEEKTISPLQPYQGDSIFEGRWGNSLRLSSTCGGGKYTINPPWIGNDPGDPITILSNGRPNKEGRKFVVETPNKSDSILYLTSTQKISDYNFPSTIGSVVKGVQNYDKPQLIGMSSRIVLSAQTNDIILGAKKRIILSANEDIRIGDDTATNPVPKGKELEKILQKLISAMQAGVIGPAGALSIPSTGAQSLLTEAGSILGNLLSEQVKIKK
jgi:hypothetical protein